MNEFTKQSFVSATQLLEYLSPLNELFWPEDSAFVFRGQPSADFYLEPSAYRTEGAVTAPNSVGDKDVSVGEQLLFEAEVIQQFIEGSDSCGLQLPGDSPIARDIFKNMGVYLETPSLWPPAEIHQILAAAQHHGVPTCLLDWTRRQYIAAYFAASSALHLPSPPRHIAIWAISTGESDSWDGLRLISMAGSTSVNLAAQSGLFTLSTLQQNHDDYFTPMRGEWVSGFSSVKKIRKMTLPFSEVKALLLSLNKLGVSAATLFPGYEGVARAVKDWAKLNRKEFDRNQVSIRDLI